MSDEETSEELAPKPSKLPLILTVVNIVLTAVVAFKVITFKIPPPPPPVVAEPPPPGPGPVHEMEAFVVNLNEPQGRRFLKAVIEAELESEKVREDLTREERPIRDAILRYLSSLKVSDTMGEEAKVSIQQQLVERMNQKLGEGKVKNVYFAQFVIQ